VEVLKWQEVVTQVIELAGNKEQNAHVPPYMLSNAGRLVTDYVLNELVAIYPNSQAIVDKARPFLKRKIVAVENGLVTLPSDYRNILSIMIAVDQNYTSKCECEVECVPIQRGGVGTDVGLVDTTDPDSPLYDAAVAAIKKEKCEWQKVDIVDSDQFADRTTSSLRPPTYKKPIGVFIDSTTIKICPTDITYVQLLYVKQPKKYNIAYTLMPDDTWRINTADASYVELEWERNAAPEIFRGMLSLYSLHVRDGNLNDWQNVLKKAGLF